MAAEIDPKIFDAWLTSADEVQLEIMAQVAMEELAARFDWRLLDVKLRVDAKGFGTFEWKKSRGRR